MVTGNQAAAAALWLCTALASARGASPSWVTKLVHHLPRTHEELSAAHAASKASCLQVANGDPLEVPDFAGKTTYEVMVRDGERKVPTKLEYDFSRLGAISIAMRLLPNDEAQLPSVSKGRILKRVNGNYIVIQLRVHRDSATGHAYLYYKPFAAVGDYTQPGAQEFAPLMEDSVHDTRGIGLFVRQGEPITAERLRTFVAVSRDVMTLSEPDGSGEVKPREHYEFLFVQARIEGDAVTLHTFVTNEFRSQLNYLRPFAPPSEPAACDLANTIYFTEYTAAKQSPSKKVTRNVAIQARARFAVSDLDRWVSEAGLSGDAWDNLADVLSAIIDGKIAGTNGTAGSP